MKAKALAILSLFASTSTLLCCALPTLLVTLGLGAVVANAVWSLPWLAPLSRNKEWVFLAAGLLVAANWAVMWRWQRTICEIPAEGASSPPTACETAGRFSWIVLGISTGLYVAGFIVAFLAFPVAKALGWL